MKRAEPPAKQKAAVTKSSGDKNTKAKPEKKRKLDDISPSKENSKKQQQKQAKPTKKRKQAEAEVEADD
jgi:hypothetical protein